MDLKSASPITKIKYVGAKPAEQLNMQSAVTAALKKKHPFKKAK